MKEPILFLTRDQTFTGANMIGLTGQEFNYVTQPAFIDAVIQEIIDGFIWKLTRYFQDDSFATPLACSCSEPVEPATNPAVQYEMYNLATDPYEQHNLAYDEDYAQEFDYLLNLLNEQMAAKALTPNQY